MRCAARLLFLVPLLASCAKPDDRTVLRVANWGGAGGDAVFERTVQQIIREFEAENPGVRVQIENIPGEYVQKMLLNHVAGSMPDIMVVDASSAADFIDSDILTDLTQLAAQEDPKALEEYWPEVLATYRRGERLYAIPNDFTPMVMYYNKALFDEAGVPYPKPGWTFADFREAAMALTKPDKGQYGFSISNWMPGWVMWTWNNGGDAVSPDGTKAEGYLDSPASVQAIEFLRDLVVKDRCAPTLSTAAAMGVDPFAYGRCAMTVSGHWSMVDFRKSPKIDWKKIGVAELPHNTPHSQTVAYMSGYGIPAQATNKELAWKYIRAWTSHKTQQTYNATGVAVCGRKDVAAERAGVGIEPPNPEQAQERAFIAITPTARPPYGSRIPGYAIVEKLGQSAMDTILTNGGDVKAVLSDAAQKIDREFAKRL